MFMDYEMKKAIAELRRPEDIMCFLDGFIRYGCIDVDGVEHVNSLGGKDFRVKFRTLGLEDSLQYRIGACIEQANITKYLLNQMDVKSRTFCTRGYNDAHPAPDDLYLIHCYVLARFGDKVLNIEHSDSEKRGIYVYYSAEEAIRETHRIFSNKFILNGAVSTTLDEYEDFIPGGLSFHEVNQYISRVTLQSLKRTGTS